MWQRWLEPRRDQGVGFESQLAFAEPLKAFSIPAFTISLSTFRGPLFPSYANRKESGRLVWEDPTQCPAPSLPFRLSSGVAKIGKKRPHCFLLLRRKSVRRRGNEPSAGWYNPWIVLIKKAGLQSRMTRGPADALNRAAEVMEENDCEVPACRSSRGAHDAL